MAAAMYIYMHALITAKLESQRAGSTTSGEGTAAAGLTKLSLSLYYCRTHETPGAPEDTRGIRRDANGTGGHRDTTRTGGHSGGGRERQQEDRREQRGDRSKP
jgi:hypothetical protein